MKWKTLEKKQIFKAGFVTISSEKCELPDGRVMPNYYTLHLPHWVNIVPFTEQGEVILRVEKWQETTSTTMFRFTV